MRISAYLLAALFTLTGLLVLGAGLFVNSELARSQLEAALLDLLGRRVHIGAQQIDWGTTVTVTFDDVRVASPDWSKHSDFVAWKKLQLKVRLGALLERPIRLQSLDINGFTLNLEQLDDGRASWVFDDEGSDPDPSDTPETSHFLLPVIVDQSRIIGTKISFKTPSTPLRSLSADITQTINNDSLTLRLAGSVSQTTALDGPPFSAVPLTLTLGATPLKQLIEFGAAQLTLNGQLGKIDINVSADTDNVSIFENAAMTLDVRGPSTAKVGALMGRDGLPDVPFAVEAAVKRTQQKLDIRHSKLTIGKVVLDASGTVPDLATPTHADIEATLDVPELEKLAAIFSLPPQIAGPLSGSIVVSAHDADADVKGEVSTNYVSATFDGKLMRRRTLAGSEVAIKLFDDNISHALALLPTATTHQQQLEQMLAQMFVGPWQLQTQLRVTDDRYQLQQGMLSVNNDVVGFGLDIGRSTPAEDVAFTMDANIGNLQRYLLPVLDDDSLTLIPSDTLSLKTSGAVKGDRVALEQTTFSLAGLHGALTATTYLETTDTSAEFTLTSERPSRWISEALLPKAFNQPTLQLPFTADGAVQFAAGRLTLAAHKITLGENTLRGSIGLNTLNNRQSIQAEFSSPNIFMFANDDPELKGQQLPLTATIKVDVQEGRVDVDALEVVAEGDTSLSAKGDLRFGNSFDGTDFDIDARIASLQHLGFLMDVDLPDAPLKLSADISGDPHHVVAKDFSVTLGESSIAGHLRVANPDHPSAELRLQSDLLDLRPLMPALTQATAVTSESEQTDSAGQPLPPVESKTSSALSAEANESVSGKRLIPDIPIDLSPLEHFDAVVDLDIKRLVGHSRHLQDVAFDAEVSGGAVHLKNVSFTDEEGGTISVVGFANPSAQSHRVALKAVGDDINLDFSLAASEQQDQITRVDVEALLFGEANNLRDLLSGGHGFVQVSSGEGRLPKLPSGLLTNDFLDELLSALNPFRKKNTNTLLRCGAVVASLENGRLSGQPLFTLVTDRLAIVSNAEIDVTSEKLFATFKSVPQRGVGISATTALNSFVAVGGTLAKPELTVDPTGAAVKGGLAFMTGGLSLLGEGLIDRATTGVGACDKALTNADKSRLKIEGLYAEFTDSR